MAQVTVPITSSGPTRVRRKTCDRSKQDKSKKSYVFQEKTGLPREHSGARCILVHPCNRSSQTVQTGPEASREARSQKGQSSAPRRTPNTHLTIVQVRNLVAAAAHAASVGCPLNRFITINFEQAGVTDVIAAIGKYTKLARDWLTSRGCGTAFIWTRERGPVVGEHVHLLMHVPPHLMGEFGRKRQWAWLKLCGAKRRKGWIRSRPVGHSYGAAFSDGKGQEVHLLNLKIACRYLAKDAVSEARRAFGITFTADFGLVSGKRCGTSENVGAAARMRSASNVSATSQPCFPTCSQDLVSTRNVVVQSCRLLPLTPAPPTSSNRALTFP